MKPDSGVDIFLEKQLHGKKYSFSIICYLSDILAFLFGWMVSALYLTRRKVEDFSMTPNGNFFPGEICQLKRSPTSDNTTFLRGIFYGGTSGSVFIGIIVRNSVSEFA